ncbi:hypothetical protein PTKIN_Ptkin18bG0033800 [Pterospermum kingtungense]
MRKLKIGEGTPEKRAKVEEARQNYYKNRFHVKPSSDLLWQMQSIAKKFSVTFTVIRMKMVGGDYTESHSIMFSTALNNICFRMLGEGPHGGQDNACERARKWILDRGGVTAILSWGKIWLSAPGLFEWSGCHPMPPEFWLLPSYFPINPGNVQNFLSYSDQY